MSTNKESQQTSKISIRFSLFTLLFAFTCLAGYLSSYLWGIKQIQTQNNSAPYVISYSVADLVRPVDAPEDASAELQKLDTLIDSVTSSVDTQQWVENGGSVNTIQPYPGNLCLIVNCPKSTHSKLAGFFQSLREK